MKYTRTFRTYNSSDCTSTGWLIESNNSRARLTYRTRWQGSRNGVVFLTKVDGPLSDEQAAELARDLDEAMASGKIERIARGQEGAGFRCIDAGYIVR